MWNVKQSFDYILSVRCANHKPCLCNEKKIRNALNYGCNTIATPAKIHFDGFSRVFKLNVHTYVEPRKLKSKIIFFPIMNQEKIYSFKGTL